MGPTGILGSLTASSSTFSLLAFTLLSGVLTCLSFCSNENAAPAPSVEQIQQHHWAKASLFKSQRPSNQAAQGQELCPSAN